MLTIFVFINVVVIIGKKKMAKLKWFCFEVSFIYLKKKTKKNKRSSHNTVCVPTRPSEDGRCHWSVLEN